MNANNLIESAPLSPIQNDNPVDKVISTGIQIYIPLSPDRRTLQLGILFEPTQLIKIYIQVEALSEDILVQFKVIELHVPVSLTELFFHLGLAQYYSQKFMILIEILKLNITRKITKQIQTNLEETLKKTKELNERPIKG